VVCLHGVQGYCGRFGRLAEERLADRYHVLALDLRGHGRSVREEPWTLAAHLEDLLETWSEPAIWIGHSFGGRLVAELMAARPQLVQRAVLLDPALTVPPDYAELLAEQELAEDVSFATREEGVAAWTEGLLRPTSDTVREEVGRQLLEGPDGRFRADYTPEAVATGYREIATVPPPWFANGIPTLIVAGELSKIVSVGEVEIYRRRLGDLLHVAVVPGGHSVLWDAFDETADAIERFLGA
jgi:pimeloyl-ACP methyl ester carboxylesterase